MRHAGSDITAIVGIMSNTDIHTDTLQGNFLLTADAISQRNAAFGVIRTGKRPDSFAEDYFLVGASFHADAVQRRDGNKVTGFNRSVLSTHQYVVLAKGRHKRLT